METHIEKREEVEAVVQITDEESSVEPLTQRQKRGLYLVFLVPELDLAELASPWLPADHAARKETVARDNRWRHRGNSGKAIAARLIAQHAPKVPCQG